ncbi:MAG: hypothetical protein D6698_09450 [Gammaproteobacteria bacterium]|nr:MAG: hypothetical protein D6698_09450 [Gammaproteobacteria bacterium]
MTHFRRTLVTRRITVVLLGMAAALSMLLLSLSGLHIGIFGQQEALRWIYQSHIIAAYVLILSLVSHIIGHIFLKASKRQNNSLLFPTISHSDLHLNHSILLLAILGVAVATLAYASIPDPFSTTPAVEPYEHPYGIGNFSPSLTETDGDSFVDERLVGRSEQCASCHKEIGDQWMASMHRQAASDKAYVKNISLLVEQKGMAAARYCESCHAPLALLSGQLTKGGKHGGIAGTPAFREGIGCMGCHGIDRVTSLKGVGSYHFKPSTAYLFSGMQGSLPTKLHNFLIRIDPKAHVKEMSHPALSSPKLCATCHVQFMDKDMNGWGWVKMQDQYHSWLNGPFSGHSEQTFENEATKRCQDCHFQPVPGDDPSASREGMIVSHQTPGANSLIPWLNGNHNQMDLVRRFLQNGKVRIHIDEPRRKDAVRSARAISPKDRDTEPPFYFYLGESAHIKSIVTNQGVGHKFPAGTTDINEVWIHFRVADAQNRTVFESGHIGKDRVVDPDAYFYRSTPIDKNGDHVWKHDLFNMVGTLYKNSIPPGESDVVEYTFDIPNWVKSPLTISATVRYRKFNIDYAKWALDDDHIDPPIIDVAQETITVPVLINSEIELTPHLHK